LYREAIFTLHPGIDQPPDIRRRLELFDACFRYLPLQQDSLVTLRKETTEFKSYYTSGPRLLYYNALTVCFSVAVLAGKLQNSKDYEKDARRRLG
jgi:hypothetical protein